jgi:hypothetical protein
MCETASGSAHERLRAVPGFALRHAERAYLIEKSRIRHQSAAERSLDRQPGASVAPLPML